MLTLNTFRAASGQRFGLAPTKLLAAMVQPDTQYFGSDHRDFIAVTLRSFRRLTPRGWAGQSLDGMSRR